LAPCSCQKAVHAHAARLTGSLAGGPTISSNSPGKITPTLYLPANGLERISSAIEGQSSRFIDQRRMENSKRRKMSTNVDLLRSNNNRLSSGPQ
jgi:hypothetical protein